MGNELYYIDKDGKKSDEGLHDAMLYGPDAERIHREECEELIATWVKKGYDEKALRQLMHC